MNREHPKLKTAFFFRPYCFDTDEFNDVLFGVAAMTGSNSLFIRVGHIYIQQIFSSVFFPDSPVCLHSVVDYANSKSSKVILLLSSKNFATVRENY